MTQITKTAPDLSFLDALERAYSGYQSASWLLSPFSSSKWTCKFGSKIVNLNFGITLPDGNSLDSDAHTNLCVALKTWLCLQTNPAFTQSHAPKSSSTIQTIGRTLTLCDYFILNWAPLKIGYNGFANLTADNFKSLYDALNSSNSTAISIYRWDDRLSSYLRSAISTLSQNDIDRAVDRHPDISKIDVHPENRLTALTESEIFLSRCYLVRERLIRQGDHPYKWTASTVPISQVIYKDTLKGITQKPIPIELSFSRSLRLKREFPAKPTRYKGDEQSFRGLLPYVSIIESIRHLPSASVPVNSEVVRLLDDGLMTSYDVSHRDGRYETIPFETGQLAVRRAIEFYLSHGEEILDSYVQVAIASRHAPRPPRASTRGINYRIDIERVVTPHIRSLGVKYWQLSHQMATVERPDASKNRTNLDPSIAQSFHSRYRNNEGLFELIKVLFGAIQVTVGVVSARRQAELCQLEIDSALNQAGDLLLFDAGKTGAFDYQQRLGRPVPLIASRMIRSLQKFQGRLLEEGIISAKGSLYDRPTRHSFSLTGGATTMNDSFDWFCDYAELPKDTDGRRHYIRQHQLRRHFAMAFYWGCSNGGIDTLRWFLGHTDAAHVYRYITEATPGTILNSAKAAFVRERTASDEEAYANLLSVLSSKFKVESISLLSASELDGYIESLLEHHQITIEPEFLTSPDGSSTRMLVIVEGARYEL